MALCPRLNNSGLPLYHLSRIGPPASLPTVPDVMDLNRVTTIIGRNPQQVNYVLDSSNPVQRGYISRIHARVVREGSRHKLYDDSMNGVFINHIKITGVAILNEGDLVTFGHPNGKNIPAGARKRQSESEYQFLFGRCDCGLSGPTPTTTQHVSAPAAIPEVQVPTRPLEPRQGQGQTTCAGCQESPSVSAAKKGPMNSDSGAFTARQQAPAEQVAQASPSHQGGVTVFDSGPMMGPERQRDGARNYDAVASSSGATLPNSPEADYENSCPLDTKRVFAKVETNTEHALPVPTGYQTDDESVRCLTDEAPIEVIDISSDSEEDQKDDAMNEQESGVSVKREKTGSVEVHDSDTDTVRKCQQSSSGCSALQPLSKRLKTDTSDHKSVERTLSANTEVYCANSTSPVFSTSGKKRKVVSHRNSRIKRPKNQWIFSAPIEVASSSYKITESSQESYPSSESEVMEQNASLCSSPEPSLEPSESHSEPPGSFRHTEDSLNVEWSERDSTPLCALRPSLGPSESTSESQEAALRFQHSEYSCNIEQSKKCVLEPPVSSLESQESFQHRNMENSNTDMASPGVPELLTTESSNVSSLRCEVVPKATDSVEADRKGLDVKVISEKPSSVVDPESVQATVTQTPADGREYSEGLGQEPHKSHLSEIPADGREYSEGLGQEPHKFHLSEIPADGREYSEGLGQEPHKSHPMSSGVDVPITELLPKPESMQGTLTEPLVTHAADGGDNSLGRIQDSDESLASETPASLSPADGGDNSFGRTQDTDEFLASETPASSSVLKVASQTDEAPIVEPSPQGLETEVSEADVPVEGENPAHDAVQEVVPKVDCSMQVRSSEPDCNDIQLTEDKDKADCESSVSLCSGIIDPKYCFQESGTLDTNLADKEATYEHGTSSNDVDSDGNDNKVSIHVTTQPEPVVNSLHQEDTICPSRDVTNPVPTDEIESIALSSVSCGGDISVTPGGVEEQEQTAGRGVDHKLYVPMSTSPECLEKDYVTKELEANLVCDVPVPTNSESDDVVQEDSVPNVVWSKTDVSTLERTNAVISLLSEQIGDAQDVGSVQSENTNVVTNSPCGVDLETDLHKEVGSDVGMNARESTQVDGEHVPLEDNKHNCPSHQVLSVPEISPVINEIQTRDILSQSDVGNQWKMKGDDTMDTKDQDTKQLPVPSESSPILVEDKLLTSEEGRFVLKEGITLVPAAEDSTGIIDEELSKSTRGTDWQGTKSTDHVSIVTEDVDSDMDVNPNPVTLTNKSQSGYPESGVLLEDSSSEPLRSLDGTGQEVKRETLQVQSQSGCSDMAVMDSPGKVLTVKSIEDEDSPMIDSPGKVPTVESIEGEDSAIIDPPGKVLTVESIEDEHSPMIDSPGKLLTVESIEDEDSAIIDPPGKVLTVESIEDEDSPMIDSPGKVLTVESIEDEHSPMIDSAGKVVITKHLSGNDDIVLKGAPGKVVTKTESTEDEDSVSMALPGKVATPPESFEGEDLVAIDSPGKAGTQQESSEGEDLVAIDSPGKLITMDLTDNEEIVLKWKPGKVVSSTESTANEDVLKVVTRTVTSEDEDVASVDSVAVEGCSAQMAVTKRESTEDEDVASLDSVGVEGCSAEMAVTKTEDEVSAVIDSSGSVLTAVDKMKDKVLVLQQSIQNTVDESVVTGSPSKVIRLTSKENVVQDSSGKEVTTVDVTENEETFQKSRNTQSTTCTIHLPTCHNSAQDIARSGNNDNSSLSAYCAIVHEGKENRLGTESMNAALEEKMSIQESGSLSSITENHYSAKVTGCEHFRVKDSRLTVTSQNNDGTEPSKSDSAMMLNVDLNNIEDEDELSPVIPHQEPFTSLKQSEEVDSPISEYECSESQADFHLYLSQAGDSQAVVSDNIESQDGDFCTSLTLCHEVMSKDTESEGEDEADVSNGVCEGQGYTQAAVISDDPEVQNNIDAVMTSGDPEGHGDMQSDVISGDPDVQNNIEAVMTSGDPNVHSDRQSDVINGDPEVHSDTQADVISGDPEVHSDTQTDVISGDPEVHSDTQADVNSGDPEVHSDTQADVISGDPDVHSDMQSDVISGDPEVQCDTQADMISGDPNVHSDMQSDMISGDPEGHSDMQADVINGDPEVQCDTQADVISGDPEVQCDTQADVISGDPEVHSDMQSDVISGDPNVHSDMQADVISGDPNVHSDMQADVTSGDPEVQCDTQADVISGDPEGLGVMQSDVISGDPEVQCDTQADVISGDPEGLGDMHSDVVSESEVQGDMMDDVISGDPEGHGDTQADVISGDPEGLGDMHSDVVSESEVQGDMKDDVTSGDPEGHGDTQADVIGAEPEGHSDMQSDVISGDPEVQCDTQADVISGDPEGPSDMQSDVISGDPEVQCDTQADVISGDPEGPSDMQSDVISGDPEVQCDTQADVISGEPEVHSDMQSDVISGDPEVHSDMQSDVISGDPEVQCDTQADVISGEPEVHSDMQSDVISGDPEVQCDTQADVISGDSEGLGDMHSDVVSESEVQGDMKADVTSGEPEGHSDMQSDVISGDPEVHSDMQSDVISGDPEVQCDTQADVISGDPEGHSDVQSDVISGDPEVQCDTQADVISGDPEGPSDMQSDVISGDPEVQCDTQADVISADPEVYSDMQADVISGDPEVQCDKQADVISGDPEGLGDMHSDVVSESEVQGDVKDDVTSGDPEGHGDTQADVIGAEPEGHSDMQADVMSGDPEVHSDMQAVARTFREPESTGDTDIQSDVTLCKDPESQYFRQPDVTSNDHEDHGDFQTVVTISEDTDGQGKPQTDLTAFSTTDIRGCTVIPSDVTTFAFSEGQGVGQVTTIKKTDDQDDAKIQKDAVPFEEPEGQGDTDNQADLTIYEETEGQGDTDIQADRTIYEETEGQGDTDIQADLTIYEETEGQGDTDIQADLTIYEETEGQGDTDIQADLTIYEDTEGQGDTDIQADLTIYEDTEGQDDTDIQADLTIHEDTEGQDDTDIQADQTIYEDTEGQGDTDIQADLTTFEECGDTEMTNVGMLRNHEGQGDSEAAAYKSQGYREGRVDKCVTWIKSKVTAEAKSLFSNEPVEKDFDGHGDSDTAVKQAAKFGMDKAIVHDDNKLDSCLSSQSIVLQKFKEREESFDFSFLGTDFSASTPKSVSDSLVVNCDDLSYQKDVSEPSLCSTTDGKESKESEEDPEGSQGNTGMELHDKSKCQDTDPDEVSLKENNSPIGSNKQEVMRSCTLSDETELHLQLSGIETQSVDAESCFLNVSQPELTLSPTGTNDPDIVNDIPQNAIPAASPHNIVSGEEALLSDEDLHLVMTTSDESELHNDSALSGESPGDYFLSPVIKFKTSKKSHSSKILGTICEGESLHSATVDQHQTPSASDLEISASQLNLWQEISQSSCNSDKDDLTAEDIFQGNITDDDITCTQESVMSGIAPLELSNDADELVKATEETSPEHCLHNEQELETFPLPTESVQETVSEKTAKTHSKGIEDQPCDEGHGFEHGSPGRMKIVTKDSTSSSGAWCDGHTIKEKPSTISLYKSVSDSKPTFIAEPLFRVDDHNTIIFDAIDDVQSSECRPSFNEDHSFHENSKIDEKVPSGIVMVEHEQFGYPCTTKSAETDCDDTEERDNISAIELQRAQDRTALLQPGSLENNFQKKSPGNIEQKLVKVPHPEKIAYEPEVASSLTEDFHATDISKKTAASEMASMEMTEYHESRSVDSEQATTEQRMNMMNYIDSVPDSEEGLAIIDLRDDTTKVIDMNSLCPADCQQASGLDNVATSDRKHDGMEGQAEEHLHNRNRDGEVCEISSDDETMEIKDSITLTDEVRGCGVAAGTQDVSQGVSQDVLPEEQCMPVIEKCCPNVPNSRKRKASEDTPVEKRSCHTSLALRAHLGSMVADFFLIRESVKKFIASNPTSDKENMFMACQDTGQLQELNFRDDGKHGLNHDKHGISDQRHGLNDSKQGIDDGISDQRHGLSDSKQGIDDDAAGLQVTNEEQSIFFYENRKSDLTIKQDAVAAGDCKTAVDLNSIQEGVEQCPNVFNPENDKHEGRAESASAFVMEKTHESNERKPDALEILDSPGYIVGVDEVIVITDSENEVDPDILPVETSRAVASGDDREMFDQEDQMLLEESSKITERSQQTCDEDGDVELKRESNVGTKEPFYQDDVLHKETSCSDSPKGSKVIFNQDLKTLPKKSLDVDISEGSKGIFDQDLKTLPKKSLDVDISEGSKGIFDQDDNSLTEASNTDTLEGSGEMFDQGDGVLLQDTSHGDVSEEGKNTIDKEKEVFPEETSHSGTSAESRSVFEKDKMKLECDEESFSTDEETSRESWKDDVEDETSQSNTDSSRDWLVLTNSEDYEAYTDEDTPDPALEMEADPDEDPALEMEAHTDEDPAPEMEADPDEDPAPEMEADPDEDPAPEMEAHTDEDPAPEMEAHTDEDPAPEMEADTYEDPAPEMEAHTDEDPAPEMEAHPDKDPAPEMEAHTDEDPVNQFDTTKDILETSHRRLSSSSQGNTLEDTQETGSKETSGESCKTSEASTESSRDCLDLTNSEDFVAYTDEDTPGPAPEMEADPDEDPAPEMEADPDEDPAPEMEAHTDEDPAPEMEADPYEDPAPEMEADPDEDPAPEMEADPDEDPAPEMEAHTDEGPVNQFHTTKDILETSDRGISSSSQGNTLKTSDRGLSNSSQDNTLETLGDLNTPLDAQISSRKVSDVHKLDSNQPRTLADTTSETGGDVENTPADATYSLGSSISVHTLESDYDSDVYITECRLVVTVPTVKTEHDSEDEEDDSECGKGGRHSYKDQEPNFVCGDDNETVGCSIIEAGNDGTKSGNNRVQNIRNNCEAVHLNDSSGFEIEEQDDPEIDADVDIEMSGSGGKKEEAISSKDVNVTNIPNDADKIFSFDLKLASGSVPAGSSRNISEGTNDLKKDHGSTPSLNVAQELIGSSKKTMTIFSDGTRNRPSPSKEVMAALSDAGVRETAGSSTKPASIPVHLQMDFSEDVNSTSSSPGVDVGNIIAGLEQDNSDSDSDRTHRSDSLDDIFDDACSSVQPEIAGSNTTGITSASVVSSSDRTVPGLVPLTSVSTSGKDYKVTLVDPAKELLDFRCKSVGSITPEVRKEAECASSVTPEKEKERRHNVSGTSKSSMDINFEEDGERSSSTCGIAASTEEDDNVEDFPMLSAPKKRRLNRQGDAESETVRSNVEEATFISDEDTSYSMAISDQDVEFSQCGSSKSSNVEDDGSEKATDNDSSIGEAQGAETLSSQRMCISDLSSSQLSQLDRRLSAAPEHNLKNVRRRSLLEKIRAKRRNRQQCDMTAQGEGETPNQNSVSPEKGVQSKVEDSLTKVKDYLARCKKILDILTDSFNTSHSFNNTTVQAWRDDLQSLHKSVQLPTTVIAVVGDTGAGKSSLLNALLNQPSVLPTSGVRACTAVVVEIVENTRNQNFEADIHFLSKEEWQEELYVLLQDLTMRDGNLKTSQPDITTTEAGVAYAKVRAVYGKVSKMNDLLKQTRITQWLSRVKEISVQSAKALRDEVNSYIENTDSGSKGQQFWPIVKRVKLFLPSCEVCRSGAVLVDLPGVRDANAARDKIAKQYLKDCTSVWVVASIHRAIDDHTAKDLLGENFRRQLLMDGQYGNVAFICTKTDSLIPSELKKLTPNFESLNNQLETVLEELSVLESRQKLLKQKSRKQKSEIDAMREEYQDLKEELDQEEVPSDEEEEGDSMKQGVAELKQELEKMDVEMQQKEADIEDLLAQEKEVAQQMSAKKDISNVHQRKLVSMCAKARNEYSMKQIKKDFRTGIRELKQKSESVYMEEDDILDYDDNEGDDEDDTGNMVDKLKVFCVSSTDYMKMMNLLTNVDGAPQVFSTLEETQIPALREFVHTTSLQRQDRGVQQVVEKIGHFVFDLDNYLKMSEYNGKGGGKVKPVVKKHVTALLQKIDPIVSQLRKDIQGLFDSLLNPSIEGGSRLAGQKAPATSDRWGSKVNKENRPLGGLPLMTYRATVTRQGKYHSPTAGPVDFNTELAEPLLVAVASCWSKVFGSLFWYTLEKVKTSMRAALESFNEDVKNNLTLVGFDKQQIETVILQILRNATVKLNEMVELMKDYVTSQQREISRIITPNVQKAMLKVYEMTSGERGDGCYNRMKQMMARHVDSCGSVMFHNTVTEIKNRLSKLQESVVEKVKGVLTALCRGFKVYFEPLWQTPDNCHDVRQNFSAGVSQCLSELHQLFRDCGLEFPALIPDNTVEPDAADVVAEETVDDVLGALRHDVEDSRKRLEEEPHGPGVKQEPLAASKPKDVFDFDCSREDKCAEERASYYSAIKSEYTQERQRTAGVKLTPECYRPTGTLVGRLPANRLRESAASSVSRASVYGNASPNGGRDRALTGHVPDPTQVTAFTNIGGVRGSSYGHMVGQQTVQQIRLLDNTKQILTLAAAGNIQYARTSTGEVLLPVTMATARGVPCATIGTAAVNVPVSMTTAKNVPCTRKSPTAVIVPVTMTTPAAGNVQCPRTSTAALNVPVAMTAALNVPVAMVAAGSVPVAMTTAGNVPVAMTTAGNVPVAMTTARNVPVAMTTAGNVPINNAASGTWNVPTENSYALPRRYNKLCLNAKNALKRPASFIHSVALPGGVPVKQERLDESPRKRRRLQGDSDSDTSINHHSSSSSSDDDDLPSFL